MLTPSRYDAPPSRIRMGKRLLHRTKPIAVLGVPAATYEVALNTMESSYIACQQARAQEGIALGVCREARLVLDEQVRSLGLAIVAASRGRRGSDLMRK